jgi:O-antigen ligase
MQAAADDVPSLAGSGIRGFQPALPIGLLALLLTVVSLQRGGYFAESWGIPTVACGWVVALAGLLGTRQRLRRLELVQLASFTALGTLALLSSIWAPGGLGSALPQTELLALQVGALAAILMLFRRPAPLLITIWASVVAISAVSLSTRLFPSGGPHRLDDSGRLSDPIGYWNGLGLWAAMGLALGIVLAARAHSSPVRALAAASCVPCAATLYFTFSRGAWIALAAGLLVAIAVDPRRLGLTAWILLLAPWPAVGLILASRSKGLTGVSPTLEQASHDGRSLALAIVILCIAAGSATLALARLERRWRAPPAARTAFACALLGACALGLAGAMVRFGAPWTVASRVAHDFKAPPRIPGADLNGRLFDISSNGRVALWRVAWDDAERHPLVGSGAGSYASEWYRNRPQAFDSTNAHQLYLETLAELGPPGLALLLLALAAPLLAAWRARGHPLAAGATAAYVAFLVHLAVDWDWQLAAVSMVALACGAALFVMARHSRSATPGSRVRFASVSAGVALAAFALWTLHASYPLGQARDAIGDGRWASAERDAGVAAARAGGSSALPWQLLGEAQTALRKPDAARASLRIAVRRDPSSWQAWYDLATVSHGGERRAAASKALVLNPLGPETRSLAQVAGITPSSP